MLLHSYIPCHLSVIRNASGSQPVTASNRSAGRTRDAGAHCSASQTGDWKLETRLNRTSPAVPHPSLPLVLFSFCFPSCYNYFVSPDPSLSIHRSVLCVDLPSPHDTPTPTPTPSTAYTCQCQYSVVKKYKDAPVILVQLVPVLLRQPHQPVPSPATCLVPDHRAPAQRGPQVSSLLLNASEPRPPRQHAAADLRPRGARALDR